MKKARWYIYSDYEDDIGEFVFKSFNKESIRKYLGVTKYNIAKNCWRESTININFYYKETEIVDLTG